MNYQMYDYNITNIDSEYLEDIKKQIMFSFNKKDSAIATKLLTYLTPKGYLELNKEGIKLVNGHPVIKEILLKLQNLTPIGIFSFKQQDFWIKYTQKSSLSDKIKNIIIKWLNNKICFGHIKKHNYNSLKKYTSGNIYDYNKALIFLRNIPESPLNQSLELKEFIKKELDIIIIFDGTSAIIHNDFENRATENTKKLAIKFCETILNHPNQNTVHDIINKFKISKSACYRILSKVHVQMPDGKLIPLKLFINKTNTKTNIQTMDEITSIINQEAIYQKLSDEKIKKQLQHKGINLSRRLITKTRHKLSIANSYNRRVIDSLKLINDKIKP